jgi:hypothetical protein
MAARFDHGPEPRVRDYLLGMGLVLAGCAVLVFCAWVMS